MQAQLPQTQPLAAPASAQALHVPAPAGQMQASAAQAQAQTAQARAAATQAQAQAQLAAVQLLQRRQQEMQAARTSQAPPASTSMAALQRLLGQGALSTLLSGAADRSAEAARQREAQARSGSPAAPLQVGIICRVTLTTFSSKTRPMPCSLAALQGMHVCR